MSQGAGRSMRSFTVVWLGQLVSLVGSGLTGFVLGVWAYQRTGEASQLSAIFLCNTLPGILLSPLAGALVDRWDRRRVMIGSDCVAAASTLALALLFVSGEIAVWHIYLATAVSSAASAFQLPAYRALLPQLVPAAQLGRANGMVEAAGSAQILSPLVAGLLVATLGIPGVLVLDLSTFGFAVVTLLFVKIAATAPALPEEQGEEPSLFAEVAYGWRYVRERPGLFWLMVLFGAYNFLFGIAGVLVQPLILSFASVATLGLLMFAGGSGMLAGGLVASAWGGPRRRIRGVLAAMLAGGVLLFLHGTRPSVALIAVVAPAFLFTLPIMNSCSMAILQTKVAAGVQGRVFATARLIAQSCLPLAYAVAGPLADRVFTPWLLPGGALAGSVGRWIGVGPGRGIALIFLAVGIATAGLALLGSLQPRLRRLDEELPDLVAEEAAAPTAVPQVTPASADAQQAAASPSSGGAPVVVEA